MKLFIVLGLVLLAFCCDNYNGEMSCQSGDQTDYPEEWAERIWQTPQKGDSNYKDSYEDLSKIQCFTDVVYSSDKMSADLDIVCKNHPDVKGLKYSYNGGSTFVDDSSKHFDECFSEVLQIVVQSDDGDYQITLEDVDFVWNAPTIEQDAVYEDGQKGGIVELFGWPYEDVEKECEFLAQAGWMGVKVFPPNEQVMSDEWPQEGELNPWWFSYQPVSYKLSGRLGSRDQLRSMIHTCRSHGVRVYADAVINHMSGGGNDAWDQHIAGNCDTWGAKASSGGSPYYTHDFLDHTANHTSQTRPGMEYPSVPYGPEDFHCERSLNSWTDGFILNYGWLVGLSDLNTEHEYVQNRIAAYFTDLIGIGFSGFRIDAAKHIYPKDLAQIFARFKTKMGGELPADWMTYLEVIIGGEASLLMCNEGDYNFGASFEQAMRDEGLTDDDIYKVKIWSSDYPKEFPVCGLVIAEQRFAVENDCHDDQNPGSSSRDMQDKGSVLIKDRNVDAHRGFETLLFSRRDYDWKIKLVLSSYSFMNDGAAGYPDGKSDCDNCVGIHCDGCSKSMKKAQAYDPDSCGYDVVKDGEWQEGAFTRVHRDMDIINAMREWQGLGAANGPEEIGLGAHCGFQQAKEVTE